MTYRLHEHFYVHFAEYLEVKITKRFYTGRDCSKENRCTQITKAYSLWPNPGGRLYAISDKNPMHCSVRKIAPPPCQTL